MIAETTAESLTDPLSQLEWRVARRADEIAHARHVTAPLNLHCWLVAEREIWSEFSRHPITAEAEGAANSARGRPIWPPSPGCQ